MSYSTLYLLYRTKVVEVAEYRNGWHSAPVVWDHLSETYLGKENGYFRSSEKEMQDLWNLARDLRVPKHWRLAHRLTFDNAVIPKDRLVEAAGHFRLVGAEIDQMGKGQHWTAIANSLEQIASGRLDHRLVGVVLNCTSVNDYWRYKRQPMTDAWDAMAVTDRDG